MPASPRISFRLPAEMAAALKEKAAAADLGGNLGEYVRRVLARHLKMPAPEMPEGGGSQDAETRRRAGHLGGKAAAVTKRAKAAARKKL